MITSRV